LYELLAGHRPFDIPDVPEGVLVDCMIADRLRPPLGVRDWNPAGTPALDSLVRHCLDPDPPRRYQTPRRVRDALERHLANRPLTHAAEASLSERLTKCARRHPTVFSSTSVGVAALILIVSLGAGGWLAAEDQRNASARLRYRAFQETFEQCQF